jgi:tetratricopeptide (TPR) repeat protein
VVACLLAERVWPREEHAAGFDHLGCQPGARGRSDQHARAQQPRRGVQGQGDKDKAIETNLRIYRADPSNSSIAQSIVQELAQSGAPDKALPIIDSLISSNPGDPNMLKTKWLLQLRASKFKARNRTGEELVKIDTAAATLDYYQRQIGAAQSDSNSAKITELASKASQKFRKEVSFPMLLSQTYYRAGQLQQALDAANKATAIDPKDVRGWQLAMVAAKDMNRPDSVLAIGQRALGGRRRQGADRPNDARAGFGRGEEGAGAEDARRMEGSPRSGRDGRRNRADARGEVLHRRGRLPDRR